jgi:hypothetical protein
MFVLTRNLGPCKSPRMAIGCEYFSSISRIIKSRSFFCSCEPCEKLRRKTSAPARNNFSIISLVDEAGPKVATCLVDLRQRCATMGAVAIDVCLGRGAAGVVTPLGAMMLENRALSRVERPNEGDIKPGTNDVVDAVKLAVTRIWNFMVIAKERSIGTCLSLHA